MLLERSSDKYIEWLRDHWLNQPKRQDLSKTPTAGLNVEKNLKAVPVGTPRPRHPSRRSATGGQKY